jgi:hypothetical protein
MSLLTVDVGGANETVVRFSRAGHAEPRTVGARRFAFAGNERSMIRAEPHIIPLVGAGDTLAATVATLRSIFVLGAAVYCAGDVFNNGGVSVLCSGELTDEMEVGGSRWIPTLTLTQVTSAAGGLIGAQAAATGAGTVVATIGGPRRTTVASGAGTATVALSATRLITVSAAGTSTVTATEAP